MNLGPTPGRHPGTGRLLIETADVERDESFARLHPEARAVRYVMLAVSDTGEGIDEDTKARIFEPFFLRRASAKGRDSGSRWCRASWRRVAATFEVYSEKGSGTTFKIYLPALTDEAAEAPVPTATPAQGGTETVLIVEDQAEVRKFAAAVLKRYGYRVIPAENADDALLFCERERFDLVLTDVVMPHASGRELADRLEKLQPGIKVLFMSGYTGNVIEHHRVLEQTRTSFRSRSVRRSWPRRFVQFWGSLPEMSRVPTRVPPINAEIGFRTGVSLVLAIRGGYKPFGRRRRR